ncbi:MAG: hypothetical protein KF845_02760 [Cyclobacteriaceae bacterium]|nr:hypothetical protein [Cyclobacteriaceae bacterium]
MLLLFFMLVNYIEFWAMNRIGLIGVLLMVASAAWSQVRVDKLVIKAGEAFEFDNETDILVADTLVMMDSSRLVLNELKRENFIRAKVAIIGNNCHIVGIGIHGKAGRDGRDGITSIGPCRDGTNGSIGVSGLSGGAGINLSFYVEHLIVNGRLIIDLSGGNGGDGGAGGKGGDGSPGTVHCNGGDGANGGNGGRGGDGGQGGNLVISSVNADVIRNQVGTKVLFKNYGGKAGQGGRGGYFGSAGLGPSRKNGKDGQPGEYGANGVRGTEGTLTFEMNQ